MQRDVTHAAAKGDRAWCHDAGGGLPPGSALPRPRRCPIRSWMLGRLMALSAASTWRLLPDVHHFSWLRLCFLEVKGVMSSGSNGGAWWRR
jgi:hypothetical protein